MSKIFNKEFFNDINRDKYLNDLINRMHNGMIKVVTGIRRCGKSYLIFTIFKNYLSERGADEQHIVRLLLENTLSYHFGSIDELLMLLREV